MNAEEPLTDPETPLEQSRGAGPRSSRLRVIAAVVALFVVLVGGKVLLGSNGPGTQSTSAGDSITSVRTDAEAEYDAAVAAGTPVYVLFHSLS